MIIVETSRGVNTVSLTVIGHSPSSQIDHAHWAAFRAELRNAMRRSLTRLTNTFHQGYPSVVAHDLIVDHTDPSLPIRLLGSRVRANKEEFSVTLQIDDPIFPFMEQDTKPRATMPPWGAGSRLWNWVQRSDGNDPNELYQRHLTWPSVLATTRSTAIIMKRNIPNAIRSARMAHGPKGHSAYLVARKIMQQGTQGKYIMQRAFDEETFNLSETLYNIMQRYV